MDKDATEKSDAAREAFLAELARDAKKNASKGGEQSSKNPQEKTKDKKKNKDHRKPKDTKASTVHFLQVIYFLFCSYAYC